LREHPLHIAMYKEYFKTCLEENRKNLFLRVKVGQPRHHCSKPIRQPSKHVAAMLAT
jgi:hypothetical protein